MDAPTRWFSLRRRLLAMILGGVTLGWLTTLALTYRDAHHEIDALADAQLVQAAQTLLALAGEYDDDDDVADLGEDGHKYRKHLAFQLWDEAGRLLLRSPGAPAGPFTQEDGFSQAPGHHPWRFYARWDGEHRLRVVVAEDHRVREQLSGHIAGRLLLPALGGLPLLGLWVWFATRRGLAPLDAVADQVAQRAPDRLEPLVPASAPTEIRPLLNALNGLFARVETTLDKERRFTADAAHELRTPLAALAAQAQVARRARDDAERDQAIDQIAAVSRRASRLVDQLLTLARLDPGTPIARADTRLDLLAAQVCADLGATALDKGIGLELDAPAPLTVRVNADLLAILLRNLVDNAIRYTPPGGQVRVAVAADVVGPTLTVRDSGPGIPPGQREEALARFHRLAGQDSEGSGLGLSIAARIAELHGARLTLGEGMGTPGLAVSLGLAADAAGHVE
ncbi:MAG: ATP-binding protein [Pseudomonadota bacterium]